MNEEHMEGRRRVLKAFAYIPPAILTLKVSPALAINGSPRQRCDQGVGNGPEGCSPGQSGDVLLNDEGGAAPGDPGAQGG